MKNFFIKNAKSNSHSNDKIKIRDIQVLHPNRLDYFGEAEAKCCDHHDPDDLSRLIKYVETLAQLANRLHQYRYCQTFDGVTYALRPEAMNHVTRILMPEFSLHTQSPLSIEAYRIFVEQVLQVAGKQHENVHLLLSTLAVVINENRKEVLNMALYIECGSNPIIHLISKSHSHTDGPNFSYKRKANFSKYGSLWDTLKEQATVTMDDENHACEFIVAENGMTIPTASVFLVELAGGAQYMQAVDICKDHDLAHSLGLLMNRAKLPAKIDTQILPYQVDHVLTSAHMERRRYAAIHEESQKESLICSDDIEVPAISRLSEEEERVLMTLTVNEGHAPLFSWMEVPDEQYRGYQMNDTPFGQAPMIFPLPERVVNECKEELYEAIQNKNMKILGI